MLRLHLRRVRDKVAANQPRSPPIIYSSSGEQNVRQKGSAKINRVSVTISLDSLVFVAHIPKSHADFQNKIDFR